MNRLVAWMSHENHETRNSRNGIVGNCAKRDSWPSKPNYCLSRVSCFRVFRGSLMLESASNRLRLPRRDLDRPAHLSIDQRLVAVVIRLRAPEVERHQIGDDVLAERTRRQSAHAGFCERRIEDRAARFDVERAPRGALRARFPLERGELCDVGWRRRRTGFLQARMPVSVRE